MFELKIVERVAQDCESPVMPSTSYLAMLNEAKVMLDDCHWEPWSMNKRLAQIVGRAHTYGFALKRCMECKGEGESGPAECSRCHGVNQVECDCNCPKCDGWRDCPKCDAVPVKRETCTSCHGYSLVRVGAGDLRAHVA